MSLRLLLTAAATWLVAGLWRLQRLDQVSIGSDSIGPFLAAWSARPHHLPMPPNPEAGFSLWVTAWPLVHLASSLEQLFALRFWQGALVAPLTLLATHQLTKDTRAALLAAALVTVDAGLTDTLVSSFRGYAAPELVALATLGLASALAGQSIGLLLIPVSLVAAAGQHPFATGTGLAALTALPWLARVHRPRMLLLATVVGTLCCLPRLWWMYRMADCPTGDALQCLSTIAWGSSETDLDRPALLWRAIQDRSTETTYATGLVLVGLGVALWKRAAAAAWALGAILGILILGLSVHSLRPYHLRIAAAPLAVAAALGWTHMGRAGWAMGCVAVGLTMMAPAPLGDTDAIQRHDQLAQRLADASPAWVDAAWDNGPMRLEPSAVVLSAVLQGTPAEDLRPTPTRPLLLLLSTTDDAPPQAMVTGEGWAVLRFPRAVDAQAWINQNGTVEGAGVAGDWVGALFPGDPQDAAIHTP